jgi:hypothetical protein
MRILEAISETPVLEKPPALTGQSGRSSATRLGVSSLVSAVAPVILASCGAFGADGERYEKLERLRVLAIRSEPPDLSVGETATLSANVYESAGQELSYEWSWCPSRGGSLEGFECNISEAALRRAWRAAGLDGPPPTYTLGSDPEVELTHHLTPALVTALCQPQAVENAVDERLALACFEGFEASIELTVRTSREELIAIKSLPLQMVETDGPERNTNPPSDFDVSLRDDANGAAVEEAQPLRAGHRYTVTADVDDRVAESFTPSAFPDEPNPEERRETLVMSWFITVGELAAPNGSDGFAGENGRTTFVDGSNDLEDLLRNGWQIPLNAGPNAELHLVLRDERGGTGWTTRRFDVVGGER